MTLLLGFLISLAIGTVALWFIGMFSPDTPPILNSLVGALVIETLSIPLSFLGGLGSFLIMLTIIVVIVKIVGIGGVHAFFAAILYGAVKLIFALILIGALMT
jgi:hypothetical protein